MYIYYLLKIKDTGPFTVTGNDTLLFFRSFFKIMEFVHSFTHFYKIVLGHSNGKLSFHFNINWIKRIYNMQFVFAFTSLWKARAKLFALVTVNFANLDNEE